MIDFDFPDAMDGIVERSDELAMFDRNVYPRVTQMMDICAIAGGNGNVAVDFDALLAADFGTFAHDVTGIMRHMNRETGLLEGCFVPRTAITLQGE